MKKVIILKEYCKGCGRCVDACPLNIISMSKEINAMNLPVADAKCPEKCCGCARCFYSCPEPGAIVITEVEDEK